MKLGFAGLKSEESEIPFAARAVMPSTRCASAIVRSANGIGIPANHR